MKIKLLLIITVFCLLCFPNENYGHVSDLKTFSANEPSVRPQELCLEISGRVIGIDEGVVSVKLFSDNKAVDSISLAPGKVFSFKLKQNTYYTIKILLAGRVSRSIGIDTELPDSINISPLFRFHFDITLLKQSSVVKFDKDNFEFPIALISFQKDKGWFDYSRKYTSLVKKQVIKTGN